MTVAALALLGQCLLGVAAMGCLSLAMPRHARQVNAIINRPIPTISMRWIGWGLLSAMLVMAIYLEGWGFGLVSTLGALSLSTLLVILLLTYQPGWIFHIIVACTLAGFLMITVQSILN